MKFFRRLGDLLPNRSICQKPCLHDSFGERLSGRCEEWHDGWSKKGGRNRHEWMRLRTFEEIVKLPHDTSPFPLSHCSRTWLTRQCPL